MFSCFCLFVCGFAYFSLVLAVLGFRHIDPLKASKGRERHVETVEVWTDRVCKQTDIQIDRQTRTDGRTLERGFKTAKKTLKNKQNQGNIMKIIKKH